MKSSYVSPLQLFFIKQTPLIHPFFPSFSHFPQQRAKTEELNTVQSESEGRLAELRELQEKHAAVVASAEEAAAALAAMQQKAEEAAATTTAETAPQPAEPEEETATVPAEAAEGVDKETEEAPKTDAKEMKSLRDHNVYLQQQVATQQGELERRAEEESKYSFLKNQNLDYLKNLVLQFLVEKRPLVKERMLPVLDDILELSEEERLSLTEEFPTVKFRKR